MKHKRIDFCMAFLDKREEDSVIKVLRSGWLTTGPCAKRFEKDISNYLNSPYAVAVNSCTAALHLALICSGIKKGDEVITTPITFSSTANVICHVGAKPVFVDVKLDDLNIDAERIEQAISKKTKAIIPVHIAGNPCDMDKILKIARKHSLIVIEDAAHALGASFAGKKIGSISDFTAFSFYATKNITTGEGGMLCLKDRHKADMARVYSLHGISRDAWKRYARSHYKHWETLYPGYKYNMSDIQAAIGVEQLKKINKIISKRKEITLYYRKAFSKLEELSFLKDNQRSSGAYHLFMLKLGLEALKICRDEFMFKLEERGVGVGVHFRAIHLHPYYRKTFGFKKGSIPNAEYISDRIVSIPLYPSLTKLKLDYIINTIFEIILKNRK